MKNNWIILLVLLLLPVGSVCARELSLSEALNLARGHSFALKRAGSERAAYEENLKATVAERFPTLSLTGLASYKDEVALLDLELSPTQRVQRDLGTNETYQTDLRLTLPLFTGGRIGGGIDMARATTDYYRALEQAGLEELLYITRVQYLTLYYTERMVEVSEATLRRAEIINDDIRNLHSAGAADSVDLLETRSNLTQAQFQLKSAVNARKQQQINLVTLLGLEPSEEITLSDRPGSPDPTLPVHSGLVSDKPELRAAAAVINVNRSSVRVNRAAWFPTLSLYGGYSWGKPNIDMFNDEFNDYFTAGLNLNWSFNLGRQTRSNVSMSKYQLTAARNERDRIQERLDREALLALESLALASEKYLTAREKFQIATDNYRLAQGKHRQGALSANRLLEIETSLSEAESTLATAQVGFYIVQSKYLFAIGSDKITEGF